MKTLAGVVAVLALLSAVYLALAWIAGLFPNPAVDWRAYLFGLILQLGIGGLWSLSEAGRARMALGLALLAIVIAGFVYPGTSPTWQAIALSIPAAGAMALVMAIPVGRRGPQPAGPRAPTAERRSHRKRQRRKDRA
ncbi:MAG: hypothetical protein QGF53_06540 [Alphaproteobacteria bacterium]|jgi:peptidoglycan/LPS O-acetylase OafA/YrhL|nr:hypothetical protein [Alphaproteobacteria bacterium]